MLVVQTASWMVLSAAAVEHVLRRYADDTSVLRYFSRIRCADEIYMPSLLHSHTTLRVQQGITSYARFDEGAASPVWAGPEEVEQARALGAAFVRKIPPGTSCGRDAADAVVASR